MEHREQPLSTMILYSVAIGGTNMVNAFTNFALPLFLGRYNLPAVVVGFLAQERSFVGGFVQPIVGAISDRLRTPLGRRRPFFLIGVPLVVASLLFISIHPPLWALLLILLIFSFFLAVANDPYLALIADLFPPQQRGRVGAAQGVFNFTGQVLFMLVAYQLWVQYEPLVFYLTSLGLTLAFAITFFTIREPSVAVEPTVMTSFSATQYGRNVLQYRELVKYAVALFFFWFGGGAAVPFLTRFGVNVMRVDEGTAFLVVMVALVSTGVFSVPSGIAGDIFGKKRVISLGLLLFGVITLIGSQVQNVQQGVVIMAFVGIANAMVTTLAIPFLADLMPKERAGEFIGLGSLVWTYAQPIGSTTAGLVIDLTGSYRSVFVVTGLVMFISWFLLRGVRPELAPAEVPQPAQEPTEG